MKPLPPIVAAKLRRKFGAEVTPATLAEATFAEIRASHIGPRGCFDLAVWLFANNARPWWLPPIARFLQFSIDWELPTGLEDVDTFANVRGLERISEPLRAPEDVPVLASMLGLLERTGQRYALIEFGKVDARQIAVFRLASECRPVDPETDPAGDTLSDVGTE